MDKELILKDGLLYFGAVIAPAAGSLLLAASQATPGLILYGMALVALIVRTFVKNQEVQPKQKK